MGTYRRIIIVLFVLLIAGIVAGTAIAGTPPPVPTLAPAPAPPSSGGGTPSYSAPPAFEPYADDLKSTDGTVIGKLTGIDYTTVQLTAHKNAIITGDSISVDLRADLNSKPLSAALDINIGDTGSIPGGMDNVITLSAASIIAESSYGWSIKPGMLTITFTIPASALGEANADTQYYIVRYDGSGYQIMPVDIVTGGSSATATAKIPDLSGTYTLVMSCPPRPAATPTPSPAPKPVVPCPTPVPESTGLWGLLPSLWASVFGTFAIGEVAGALMLIVMGRFMK